MQVLRLPLHGTPGPKGRPRNDRKDAGVAGSRAHARSRQEITRKMADQKMRVVCVSGYSCGWPLAGVGSRPPGHQARSFCQFRSFVWVCPHSPPSPPRAPNHEETRRVSRGRGFTLMPMTGCGTRVVPSSPGDRRRPFRCGDITGPGSDVEGRAHGAAPLRFGLSRRHGRDGPVLPGFCCCVRLL